ncbi:MAG: PAS domain S-box [Solidesulfovibrio magneticus str. Maddingley MBC34]|uniref:histidine kinase n=1 Tax=Solidesulfovibrio magneticus str. Maddingley MBC34 TaxID=1206767 RepID=K6HDI3_9BACT|nr:MAG: PAS domain S-box [Solidesulfovibrio magneticus str. Maddingley MBC34]
MGFDAYRHEKEIITHAKSIANRTEVPDLALEYTTLCNEYEKIFSAMQRLVRISDKMGSAIKEANTTIKQQKECLDASNRDLQLREKLLEEKILEFETIFNNSTVGVALVNCDGLVYRHNDTLLKMLGCEAHMLRNNKLDAFVLSSDDCCFLSNNKLPTPNGQGIVNIECQLRTADNGHFWASLSGKLLNPQNHKSGFLWSIYDISHRKELEQLREDVIRIMQHDLRGPLNAIINLPPLIFEGGNLSQDQERYLSYISNAGEDMLRQIDLSRDMFQMERGSYQFLPAPVDIVAITKRVIADIQFSFGKDVANIAFSHEGNTPDTAARLYVNGNNILCYNIVMNLLKNAVEAALPAECISITIQNEQMASLCIRNKAPLPNHVLSTFFKKYATHGKSRGTGLGTYSAWLMTKAQGGTIDVASSEEEGTAVTISLPIYEQHQ